MRSSACAREKLGPSSYNHTHTHTRTTRRARAHTFARRDASDAATVAAEPVRTLRIRRRANHRSVLVFSICRLRPRSDSHVSVCLRVCVVCVRVCVRVCTCAYPRNQPSPRTRRKASQQNPPRKNTIGSDSDTTRAKKQPRASKTPRHRGSHNKRVF